MSAVYAWPTTCRSTNQCHACFNFSRLQVHFLLSNYHATTEHCTSTCFPPLRSWSHANVGCFDPTSLSSHDPISSHSNVLCIQILTFHLHKHFGYLRKHLNYAKLLLSSRLKMVRNVWNFRNVYSVPEMCFCNSQHPCTRCLPLAPVSPGTIKGMSQRLARYFQSKGVNEKKFCLLVPFLLFVA